MKKLIFVCNIFSIAFIMLFIANIAVNLDFILLNKLPINDLIFVFTLIGIIISVSISMITAIIYFGIKSIKWALELQESLKDE